MKVRIRANLLPKQVEYVNSTADIAIYHGGIGAGKTIANVVWNIKEALQHPGIDLLICTPTYPMLRDTVLREFEKMCPKQLLAKFNTGIYPEAVFIPNKGRTSTIRFRSFDTAGKPKSINVGGLTVDEVTEMKQDILNEATRRVRQPGMPNRIRFSTNPDRREGKNHYFYRTYIEPVEAGLIQKNEIHLIHTTSYENPHLPDVTMRNLERLKRVSPGEWLNVAMGEWGVFDDNAIGAFEVVPAFSTPYLVAFLDTSFSDSTVSDRTALAIVGFVPQRGKENRYWPIEFTGKSWQKSVTAGDVIDDMILFLDRFKPIEVCVESQLGDSTQIFIDRFRERERALNVSPKNHWTVLHQTKNKHERIMLEVAGNKDRLSVIDGTQPDFLNRVVSYTKKADHDDEPDALAGAINLWRTSKNLREYILRSERRRA